MIEDLISVFKDYNVNFECYDSSSGTYLEFVSKFKKNIPLTDWGRINWSLFKNKICFKFETYNEQKLVAKKLIDLIPCGEYVYVMWFDASKPILKITREVFFKFKMEIFDEDMDTWIVESNFNWVLECYHDGEISLVKLHNRKK